MQKAKSNADKSKKYHNDTDDENYSTDDDLDDNEQPVSYETNPTHVAIAPRTINVTALTSNETERLDEAVTNKVDVDIRLINFLDLPIKELVMMPLPLGLTMCTRIYRDKTGFKKGMYPMFIMYLDMYTEQFGQKLLLVARQRKKSRGKSFVISVERKGSKNDRIGKIKSNNLISTIFTAYDNGNNPKKSTENRRIELINIMYQLNPMGFSGPRKVTAVLPTVDLTGNRKECIPSGNSDSLHQKSVRKENDGIIILGNKEPEWNQDSGTFQLDFQARVTYSSVKNFQLIHHANKDAVLYQSGKVGPNEFTCDFTHPFCIYQAFALAVTSLTDKIGCA